MRTFRESWKLSALILLAAGGGGCNADPIEADGPSRALNQCCAEARQKVASVHDVASDDFRARCDACRRGESKRACAAAAAKVHATVQNAYGEFSMPVSCSRLMSALREEGIE